MLLLCDNQYFILYVRMLLLLDKYHICYICYILYVKYIIFILLPTPRPGKSQRPGRLVL